MFNIKQELKKLPLDSGVYIMKDKNNQIIYIGKAKILKNRIRSYFQKSAQHNQKTLKLIENIVFNKSQICYNIITYSSN